VGTGEPASAQPVAGEVFASGGHAGDVHTTDESSRQQGGALGVMQCLLHIQGSQKSYANQQSLGKQMDRPW